MKNGPYSRPSRYYGDKFPRTLQEAFGPYAGPLVEPRRSFLARHGSHLAWMVIVAAFAVSYVICRPYLQ